MTRHLLFIVSVPRSGSTVLTSMLDRYTGVASLPECGFPQLLAYVTPSQWSDKLLMAAAYLRACFGGSLLSLDEAAACIVDDQKQSLINLGLAEAAKAGRCTDNVTWVVWKTTRLVASWASLAAMGGRFAIIRRNALNVFESYLRTDFAYKNRTPRRFALYFVGYEAIFDRYPKDRTEEFDYPRTAAQLPGFLQQLGIDPDKKHDEPSTLKAVSSRFDFHTEILGEFNDKDKQKITKLPGATVRDIKFWLAIYSQFKSFCGILRDWADKRQAMVIMADARIAVRNHQSASESAPTTVTP